MGEGIGILTLLVVMVASYLILQPVSDTPRAWAGADLRPREVAAD